MKPVIHFSHANGFPAPVYRKFLHYLSPRFQVNYIELLGHDPRYPVNDNWQHLVSELIDNISARYVAPVIGVGHSLGGGLTFMAALQRPELFRAIVLLDSPVINRWKAAVLALAKRWKFIDYLTPAARTKNRRTVFDDAAHAMTYLKTKSLFRHFDEECLQDYINEGMEKTAEGLQLKFSPTIEYQIYRTIPHRLMLLKKTLVVPGALIYGEKSTMVSHAQAAIATKQFNFVVQSIQGGHLFPFEHPELAAKVLTQTIHYLLPVTCQ